MEAKLVGALPAGEGWQFEPKWDGFRALVFRDGDEIFIQSRDKKPLNRYFPELLGPLAAALPPGTRTLSLSDAEIREAYLWQGKPLPEWFIRKELAAILAADVAGYSRPPGAGGARKWDGWGR